VSRGLEKGGVGRARKEKEGTECEEKLPTFNRQEDTGKRRGKEW